MASATLMASCLISSKSTSSWSSWLEEPPVVGSCPACELNSLDLAALTGALGRGTGPVMVTGGEMAGVVVRGMARPGSRGVVLVAWG